MIENEQVEFKKSTSEIKEAVISISAILNKHGAGELYFGLKNDGAVIGQDVSEKTLREVSQAIASHLEPRIFPIIEKTILANKEIIKISFSGVDKPYLAHGRAYMRVADEDRQLSAGELRKMILASEVYRSRWDSELCELTVKAINSDTLQSFLYRAKQAGRMPDDADQPEHILEKLHLIKKNTLSSAAKYLFTTEHPIEVQAAVFAGKDKLTFLDIKKYNQPLIDLLETAESYVKEKMNWRVEFVDFKRVEIPEIPLKALREALVNSLIHRDFINPKGNEIAIYKDRIEIYNPGTFPEGLSPDDYIKSYARSYLRNPLIAEIFYLTKDVEKWGSGLKRIYDECRENGVDVQFHVVAAGFVTTFLRSGKQEGFSPRALAKKVTGKVTEKVTENQRKILEAIAAEPDITTDNLSKIVGISSRKIKENIAKLKTKNLLRRIGPAKGGHWEIIDN